MTENTQELLQHHWAMDEMAARTLASDMTTGEEAHLMSMVAELDPAAIKIRDSNREAISKVFSNQSDKPLFTFGPCSTDDLMEMKVLFDYVEELREEHPGAEFAVRLNGAKPRTRGKSWKGLWYSTDTHERQNLFDINVEAFNRGIPIFTEITEGPQLGALAPILTGAWIGARDSESTALRGTMSAIHLPVGIKNPRDGSTEVVANSIDAIASNTKANKGSGADIGTIASNVRFRGIPTGVLPVGEANDSTAIIARGYELNRLMSPDERREAAISHLSEMCVLAADLDCIVLIDGSHDVPPMFEIPRSDSNRFLSVIRVIHDAISNGEVQNADRMKGILGEVGPEVGKTDRNLVLNDRNKKELSELVGTSIELIQ